MQKRILLICSIIVGMIIILTVANPKSLMVITTMAQEYVNGYVNDDSRASDKNNSQNNKPGDNKQEITTPKDKNQKDGQPQDNPLAFENTTTIHKNGKQIITNTDSLLVLVNKKRNLPADYVPGKLVIPNVSFSFPGEHQKKYLRSEAAQALEELFQAAKKEKLDLLATSGYRSYQRQKAIFDAKAKAIGVEGANRTSAYPGQSEHQTGLAMDLTSTKVSGQLVEKFGELKEGKWLKENAHKFGFIIRYPKGKETVTGYNYEPWHLRFVGKETAEYIFTKGITLEEYFVQVHDYPQI
ncbi:MAG: M15 family metallopeptidase [Desulfitobacteriaceae bacterium]|nr:M15 family metallopeptidase [Desulfitobacteriaceae bacterium]